MPALVIRQDLPATELRRLARREPDRRAAMRLLAIAHALDGFSRAEAARLAGMERQALRDAVRRHNAEGPDGLHDRPRSGRPEGLTPGQQQAALKAWVGAPRPGPGAGQGERVAPGRYLRPCRAGLRRALQRMGHVAAAAPAWALAPENQAAASPGQRGRAVGSGALDRSRNGLGSKLAEVDAAHPNERLQLWCEDEARIGQKGRTCHRWYQRGVRPPGLADKRFESLYLLAACRRPGTDEAFALALPQATTTAMSVLLAAFAAQLTPGTHAVLILDQAGWHGSGRLVVPENVTLLPLPAYSPELNPVERVWLYLRERFLSHRVLDDYAAVLDAACDAWNALVAETGRLASLTAYPYLLRSKFR